MARGDRGRLVQIRVVRRVVALDDPVLHRLVDREGEDERDEQHERVEQGDREPEERQGGVDAPALEAVLADALDVLDHAGQATLFRRRRRASSSFPGEGPPPSTSSYNAWAADSSAPARPARLASRLASSRSRSSSSLSSASRTSSAPSSPASGSSRAGEAWSGSGAAFGEATSSSSSCSRPRWARRPVPKSAADSIIS